VIACRAVVVSSTLGQETEFERALGTYVRCLLGLDMVGSALGVSLIEKGYREQ